MTSFRHKKKSRIPWSTLIRGALTAFGVLILAVLLLALFVYLEWLPESAIPIGNTVIRIISAVAAGLTVGLAREKAPWYFGGTAADLALLFSFAVMSIFLGSFHPTWSMLADLLMSFAIGSAASAVFLRRRTES